MEQELRSLTLLSPEKRLQRQAERLKDAMIRLESAWRFRLLEARRTSAGLGERLIRYGENDPLAGQRHGP